MSSGSCFSVAVFLYIISQAGPASAQSNVAPHPGGYNAAPPTTHHTFSAKAREKYHMMIVSHAIMACLVWAFMIPLGGILLRLNIKSPWMLRIHMILQMTGYAAYVISVGLGIYLFQQLSGSFFDMWKDPHGPLGIAILAMGFVEPILGWIHHLIYIRRKSNLDAGRGGKAPGRTTTGRFHLWIGRLLIVLGIINGGLGIRLTARVGYQHKKITHNAIVGYSVSAAVMFIAYTVVTVLFEIRRAKTQSASSTADQAHIITSEHGKAAEVTVSNLSSSESDENLQKAY